MDTSKLAVVYVRVSTHYQVDNYSVQDQRNLSSLAARHGFPLVEIREEQGVSAETITARPIMKALLEEIAAGKVGAIIVSSFTRLTRDIDDIDGRIIKKTCRDNDCVIITPEKLYDFTNETDDDLADLQFFFSKIQKRMNLKPMIRGAYTKAKAGGFVGIPASIGYDYTWREEQTQAGRRFTADLKINEAEAELVRMIHDLFPTMLYRRIATHLNELAEQGKVSYCPIKYQKLREKYGTSFRPWADSDIRNIIANDLYVGRAQYAVNSRSQYLRGLEPVYTYHPDLRILSDEVFERNQKIAQMRRQIHPRSKGSPQLFSGLLRCPRCGAVMAGRGQLQQQHPPHGKIVDRRSYNCSTYNKSGKSVCPGNWLPEREVVNAVLPVLTQLIQENLRAHLAQVATSDPLLASLEGEIKAELAKVSQSMKNLLDAVKAGALTMDQIREENADLQAAKRRLEKRLHDAQNANRVEDDLRAILDIFDNNLGDVLANLMEDRLRFNMFVRLFFSMLVIEIDRPGMNWRSGKKKGELPECNARITKFTLDPRFEAFVLQSGIDLPDALKKAEGYENLSENHGSPWRW